MKRTAPRTKPILPGQKALSVAQAALYAGVSPPTLRKRMRAGQLRFFALAGCHPRILIADLEQLLTAQRGYSGEVPSFPKEQGLAQGLARKCSSGAMQPTQQTPLLSKLLSKTPALVANVRRPALLDVLEGQGIINKALAVAPYLTSEGCSSPDGEPLDPTEVAWCVTWIRSRRSATKGLRLNSGAAKQYVSLWAEAASGEHCYISRGAFIAAAIGLGYRTDAAPNRANCLTNVNRRECAEVDASDLVSVTIGEASRLLGVSQNEVSFMCGPGGLKTVRRFGSRQTYINRQSLSLKIESLRRQREIDAEDTSVAS